MRSLEKVFSFFLAAQSFAHKKMKSSDGVRFCEHPDRKSTRKQFNVFAEWKCMVTCAGLRHVHTCRFGLFICPTERAPSEGDSRVEWKVISRSLLCGTAVWGCSSFFVRNFFRWSEFWAPEFSSYTACQLSIKNVMSIKSFRATLNRLNWRSWLTRHQSTKHKFKGNENWIIDQPNNAVNRNPFN